METPNFICTKKIKRAVIHFCGVEMHSMMSVQYGTVSCDNGLSVNGARS
jgi:hypothetical protein